MRKDWTIHHVGYIVRKMDASVKEFEALGYEKDGEPRTDPLRQVVICVMRKDGYAVELVSPAGKDSPLYPLVKKYRNSPYHICYETLRYDEDVEALKKLPGCTLVQDTMPCPALEGQRGCFFLTGGQGLFELLEKPER